MSPNKRLAFFGGSFNPIHNGHVFVAQQLLKDFAFEQVWVVPTANPPHKTLDFSANARLEMARLAFTNLPGVEVSDLEIQAGIQGAVYSFDTLTQLRQQKTNTEIFFVLGEDAFDYLPKWYRFPEVLGLCSFVVLTRDDWAKEQVGNVRPLQKTLDLFEEQGLVKKETVPTFAKACAAAYQTTGQNHILIWNLKTPQVSATQVREQLKNHNNIEGLVPQAVADYLKRLSVYDTHKK